MDFVLYDLYRDLKTKGLLFCYCGPIAQPSIEGIGGTLRRNLELEDVSNATSLAVFSIFIEQVQNVQNYSAERLSRLGEDDGELRIGVVAIGQEPNGDFFIYCGNRVSNEDIPRLQEHVDMVRVLSKDELKALYRERRRADKDPLSKGAGLGLIEMARKASEPIEYSFVPVDDLHSFFSLRVVVGR